MNSDYSGILIVDDDYATISLIGQILKNANISYDFALNGGEAIQKIKSNRYRTIILDVNMPIVSGLSVVQYIKNHKYESKIVACTSDSCVIENYNAFGFSDVIPKPIHHEKVNIVIKD